MLPLELYSPSTLQSPVFQLPKMRNAVITAFITSPTLESQKFHSKDHSHKRGHSDVTFLALKKNLVIYSRSETDTSNPLSFARLKCKHLHFKTANNLITEQFITDLFCNLFCSSKTILKTNPEQKTASISISFGIKNSSVNLG